MANQYSVESLGIKAPSGGFQQGGWYEGRQYWGGTLSDPGTIHPLSNQQGAGQAVSNEVIAQTNPNNVSYIQSLRNQQQPAPINQPNYQQTSGIQDSLSAYNQDLFQKAQSIDVKTIEDFKNALKPSVEIPELINREEQFKQLTEEYKTQELEGSLNELKAQEEELIASLRQQTATERGKQVSMGVIEGRIGEETRQAQEQLDFVQRQKTRVIDELNTKYNMVNMLMNFKQLDYTDAVNQYDREYKQNLDMYNLLKTEQDRQYSMYQDQVTQARANLQIYANSITAGNINYDQLPADQKVMLNKLEVMSGFPVGFISSIKRDPGEDILFTTSNQGVTQVGFRNADGSVRVESYGAKISGSGTSSGDYSRKDVSTAMQILNEVDKSFVTEKGNLKSLSEVELETSRPDQYLSQAEANEALKRIVRETGDEELGYQLFLDAWNQGGYKQWGG